MSGIRTLFSEGCYFGHVRDTFWYTRCIALQYISPVFPVKVKTSIYSY